MNGDGEEEVEMGGVLLQQLLDGVGGVVRRILAVAAPLFTLYKGVTVK